MDKLRMKSLDAVEGNVAKIAALFPHCVTERLNKEGKPELAIDFDKLRAELSTDALDTGEERYQFTWPDKRAASRLANTPTDKTLRPDVDASVDFWNTKNLYIEGDNLDVLKVLRENYLGKVKMIYIDPPYNTGNDFVYSDKFAVSSEEWEGQSGAFDEEGNQVLDPMQRNTESNGRFHTDWLNMIYPRLKVARDLLSEDGVIFISIDDHELKNILSVCGEVFGYDQIETYIWDVREPGTMPKTAKLTVRKEHEYIVACFKNIKKLSKYSSQRYLNADWTNADNDPRGPWMSANISRGSEGSTGGSKSYVITNPSGVSFDRDWSISEEEYNQLLSDNRIYFADNGRGVPRRKIFKTDWVESIQSSLFELLSSSQTQASLNKILLGKHLFDFPKPVALIHRILSISTDKDSIILDFFSGSATTAHAVMKLNAEDGGHRKFIMVQLPEVTDEKSEARKAGYETICQIGEERIRRAGKKILEEVRSEKGVVSSDSNLFNNNENSSLLTHNSSLPDVGFRVLKLDSSNMEDVFYTPEDFNEAHLFNTVDNVKSDRTPLDLLFQVMPELDIELSAKIEEREVNGKKVFFVDDTYLIATFDTEVNEYTVTEIAKMRPQYFVMRDSSAANDNVLDNFEQIFKHYSPDTIRKIL